MNCKPNGIIEPLATLTHKNFRVESMEKKDEFKQTAEANAFGLIPLLCVFGAWVCTVPLCSRHLARHFFIMRLMRI